MVSVHGHDVSRTNLVLVDGDVELGVGCALVFTPGHTDGNQSLCRETRPTASGCPPRTASLRTPGTDLSKIPGVRKWRKSSDAR